MRRFFPSLLILPFLLLVSCNGKENTTTPTGDTANVQSPADTGQPKLKIGYVFKTSIDVYRPY